MKYYLKAFKNYANFKGRATRKEFWYFVLFHFIAYFILSSLGRMIGFGFGFISNLYYLAGLVPMIAVGFRRMQDLGKVGWFIFIPVYDLILAAQAGEEGENQYGPVPSDEV